ncbi:MAG: M28 family peptidase [Promethearchaeota archaeon]|nr:MAG: M28 family peptidase [Candidatus Lokiarchaeota archaeon]
MDIEISKEDSKYMDEIIERIIDECGARMPCSPQEAKSAEIIKHELEKTCNEVTIEEFTCSPRAALGWIKIVLVMVLISFSLFILIKFLANSYWLYILSIIATILVFLVILIAWEEFFSYKEFIDPIFRKKTSQNVIGKIKPQGEIKKIIIFSGHHDSALQFNLLRYLKYGYMIMIYLGFGILFIWFFISLIFVILSIFTLFLDIVAIYESFFNIAVWLLIIGAIPIVSLFFFVTPGKRANKVPGAVDNLSAVAIILGVGRYLEGHRELIPKNTEIRIISFGCEEAFLRGAYRYVEAHLDELKKYDAECVNLDAIQSNDYITFSDKEPTTRTVHSEELIQKLVKAAELVGVKTKIASLGGGSFIEKIAGLMSGGTDATPFSKSNIKAGTITGLSLKQMVHFYHQETDTPDKIEKGVLEKALKICLGYLKS